MELQNVATLSMVGMVFSIIIAIGFPVGLCVFMKKREKANLSVFFVGAIVFFVTVLVLEKLLHTIVFSVAGTVLNNNIWLYSIYGGIMAALFEETARWLVMRHFMKNRLTKENAIMYGIGHGGAEAIILVGISNINNLVTSILINEGLFEQSLKSLDSGLYTQTINAVSALWTTESSQFFMLGIERIWAVALQIMLSVLIFLMVKTGKKKYYGIAFVIHLLIDFASVILASYLSVPVVEVILFVVVAVIGYFVVKDYRKSEI